MKAQTKRSILWALLGLVLVVASFLACTHETKVRVKTPSAPVVETAPDDEGEPLREPEPMRDEWIWGGSGGALGLLWLVLRLLSRGPKEDGPVE
jgi:hypothetical protein